MTASIVFFFISYSLHTHTDDGQSLPIYHTQKRRSRFETRHGLLYAA
jgi:hypothetical protein